LEEAYLSLTGKSLRDEEVGAGEAFRMRARAGGTANYGNLHLWLRQIKRYSRSSRRIIGAVGQPLLFLLALGYGIGSLYKRAGGGKLYRFSSTGIIAQTILFGAIFWA